VLMVACVGMKSTRSKRGRPPIASDPKLATADALIGRTVHIMIEWGMRQRTIGRGTREKLGVYEAVGLAARTELGRTDSGDQRALGPDRIKQIYEKWRKAKSVRSTRSFYTKESLAERHPLKGVSVIELARVLLKKKGRWAPPRIRVSTMSWENRVRRSLAGKPIPVEIIPLDLVFAPRIRSSRSEFVPGRIPRVKRKTG
jgi:hypothetical protein